MQTTLLNVPKALEGWKTKAENHLYNLFPSMIDSGNFHSISVGRNRDGGVGDRGGYRVKPTMSMLSQAIYLDVPKRMIMDEALGPQGNARQKTIITRASDAIQAMALEQLQDLMSKGIDRKEAQKRVNDSIKKYGYFDPKLGMFVAEALSGSGRVKDSILSGLTTPYWDISKIQKIFKQPFLRGYSELHVNKVGVPNMWADLVQIFTETFEGSARISNVAKGTGEHNSSIAAKNRTGTMLSEIINLVIDYETQTPNEQRMAGQDNWLVNTAGVGSRDAYANLMLEILLQTLYYFGDDESGFEGLTQIANRDSNYDAYPSDQPPAEYMWDNDGAGSGTGPVNMTVGADLLLMLNHMIADKLEALFFLPVAVKVTCAPVLYKALKFSMLSKVYNQNNPLSIINNAFEAGNKIMATVVTKSMDDTFRSFELVPDPMLGPNTAFNPTNEDLMFITFPTLQSELEDGNLVDLIMAPVPIDKLVLPNAPAFRDGMVRTMMKRVGSLLCPVTGTVHVIHGMGTNSRYTPPT